MRKLIILGSVIFAYFVSFAGTTNAGDATLTLDDNAGSSSFVVQDVDKTNQFKVNSDGQGYFAGKVGIGTKAPNPSGLATVGTVLHIDGGTSNDHPLLMFSRQNLGTTNAIGNIYWLNNAQDTALAVFGANTDGTPDAGTILFGTKPTGGSYSERMRITSTGNVGIGTTAPGYKLDVQSSGSYDQFRVRATGSSGTGGEPIIKLSGLYNSGNGAEIWQDVNGKLTFNINSNVTGMVIISSGNVGIGTSNPSEKLEVSGNIKASGTVSQGSSKEFKKNISYVSTKDAMKALNKLNPVRFEYKTDDSGEKHLGFIAEDVPDLVAEKDRKHLNSMDITAVLTKVVQEQQRTINAMAKKIEALETVVK